MRSNRIKANPMLTLAAILLCLVLFTTHLTSGLYAKYVARLNAEDSARVAAWNVGATALKPALSIDCSSSDLDDDYSFKVTNNSEVRVRYGIVALFDKPLSEAVSIKLNGSVDPATTDRKTFTFTNVGELNFGASADLSLVFTVSSGDVLEDLSYKFQVTVDFVQID